MRTKVPQEPGLEQLLEGVTVTVAVTVVVGVAAVVVVFVMP